MAFENKSISELKKLTPDELKEGCSFNVTSNGDFLGFFIIPPSGFLKMQIEDRVCEGERALGKRKE
jgi:hypothetical protein